MHLFEALKLFDGFFVRLFRHFCALDFFAVIFDLNGLVIVFPELFVNGPGLLAQKIIPLGFENFIFDFGFDLRLNR
jgi:hypothetical protein